MIFYADDLVLMSSSLTVLQKMIDACVHEASEVLDLTFNAKKSSIIRIGKRYKNECAAIKLCNIGLPFHASARYLGVFMCAAKAFKLSVTQPRASFYKSLNLLHTRSRRFDDTVLLSLIKTFCLPVLLYGSECMDCNTSYISYISKSWNNIFWKLFNVNASTVGDICDCMNMMTLDCMLSRRREKFKTKMAISSSHVVHFLYLLYTTA